MSEPTPQPDPSLEADDAIIGHAFRWSLLVFVMIFFSRFWRRILGDFGLRLLTRLLGLLVLAVGVQMLVTGVHELWNL